MVLAKSQSPTERTLPRTTMEKPLKNECKPENDDDYDGGGDDGMAMMIVMIEKDKEGL